MPKVWSQVVSTIQKETETMPELLDTTLREGKMKRTLLILIAALLLVQSVYAFEIPFIGVKIFEPAPVMPIYNEAAYVGDTPFSITNPKNMTEIPLKIEVQFRDGNIVDTLSGMIGFNKNVANVTVKAGDKTLAILPPGTKFENLPVHDYCLQRYQFGTEDFYECEVSG